MTDEEKNNSAPATGNELLRIKEVAKRLGVSEAWVYAHASGVRRPYLPSIKLGRSVRFRETDVDEFIEHCRRAIEEGVAIQ